MKKIFVLIIVSFIAFSFREETSFIQALLDKLEAFHQQKPQEKVYLHLDKPHYMAGDTIWLKGYLFDASTHQIDSVSRVLYVDLLDESKGKLISHKRLLCVGAAQGEIAIPDSLAQGVYTLRAYTKYMQNYSEDLFFYKSIKIWQQQPNTLISATVATEASTVSDVQFFPEGGDLVENIESRVAFKGVNKWGKGINITGFVLDAQDTVAVFSSIHLGMGYFTFKPEHDKKYKIFVRQPDGSFLQKAFPPIQTQGYVMLVDNTSFRDKIRVYIRNSHPKPADQAKPVALLVQQRGVVCTVGKNSEASASFVATIPKSSIPDDGIVQITLFSPEGQPLCERLVFHQANKQLKLSITPDKASYRPREKVTLTLEAKDAEGKPVKGNFSLAVTDGTQVAEDLYEENLFTNLLLTSDVRDKEASLSTWALRGTVEDPAYYFDPNQQEARLHLDVLMLTQGWRRFAWADILAETSAKLPFALETGLSITGKVLRPNGKPSQKVNLTIMLKGAQAADNPGFLLATSDSLGRFGLYDLYFTDSTDVLIQAAQENGKRNFSITIDTEGGSPQVRLLKIPFNPIAFDAKAYSDFLQKSREAIALEKKLLLNKVQMLQEVVVTARKEEPRDGRKIYGRASNSLVIQDQLCAGATHVLQMLQGRVAGVQVIPNNGGYKVTIRGISTFSGSTDPLYVLDGVPVDAGALASINPCDVEVIDVLKGADASIFGSTATNGVISVLTKRGNPNYDWSKAGPSEGIALQKRKGYERMREFYSPVYNNPNAAYLPDYRSTLFWKATIATDTTGKATLSYYQSDATGTMNIKVEGVSEHSRVGVIRGKYRVQ